jgi:uncharacterized protein (TIGR03118 family)
MHARSWRTSVWVVAVALAVASLMVAAPSAAAGGTNAYVVHNLVSDGTLAADHTDPNLVNAWGLTAGPTTPWWVADNGTGVSTLYTADGTPLPLVVQVPNRPTGAVFWSFSAPFFFVFAGEEGTIRGWHPSLGNQTVVLADRSGVGAIYKGLAIASTPAGDFFYATDFHNGRVDMFDGSFNLMTTPGAFVDPRVPAGFAPFGIRAIAGKIFVTYAKQDSAAEDDVAGQGLGFVDAFDTSGTFLGRVATRGQLNAPWGLAMAPASFGAFGGDLLVGNFGDGQIHAYAQLANGVWVPRGELLQPDETPLVIDGLWALSFGNGATNNGPTDTLFFTAGPDDESHGLFGTIKAAG